MAIISGSLLYGFASCESNGLMLDFESIFDKTKIEFEIAFEIENLEVVALTKIFEG